MRTLAPIIPSYIHISSIGVLLEMRGWSGSVVVFFKKRGPQKTSHGAAISWNNLKGKSNVKARTSSRKHSPQAVTLMPLGQLS